MPNPVKTCGVLPHMSAGGEAQLLAPYILDETEHFAVVYKPPFLHSAPLKRAVPPKAGGGERSVLLDWYARVFPGIRQVRGRNAWEGGILHRLDFETRGLVLFAKTQFAMDALLVQQNRGEFVKEYGALSPAKRQEMLPGFPPVPYKGSCARDPLPPAPFSMESAFRPYGPGRKAVRPFADIPLRTGVRHPPAAGTERRLYQTDVMEWERTDELIRFRLRIKRGFRHQIRCHLAWLGFPILNDALYGAPAKSPAESGRFLALRAEMFTFYDPASNEQKVYRMEL
jgi:23S rRNA pseudouridine1911/1915/1917 synthase